jgi:hypothetical protein
MSAVIKLCAAVVRQQVGRDDAEAEAWRLSALGAREEYDQLRRERDEFKAEAKAAQPSVWQPHEPVDRTSYVVSLEFELTSTKAALIDAALIHAKLIQERDDLKAKLDAELPAAWREDLVSLNECLDRVSKERDNKNSERIAAEHRAMVAERERDELKSRLAHAEADAEQAVHNEAFMERQKIAEWLRTTSRARGVLISIHSSQDLARCADAIERGEHEQ